MTYSTDTILVSAMIDNCIFLNLSIACNYQCIVMSDENILFYGLCAIYFRLFIYLFIYLRVFMRMLCSFMNHPYVCMHVYESIYMSTFMC
jgi:hypothetical protein